MLRFTVSGRAKREVSPFQATRKLVVLLGYFGFCVGFGTCSRAVANAAIDLGSAEPYDNFIDKSGLRNPDSRRLVGLSSVCSTGCSAVRGHFIFYAHSPSHNLPEFGCQYG